VLFEACHAMGIPKGFLLTKVPKAYSDLNIVPYSGLSIITLSRV